jgi:hypothetical protein
MSSLQALLDAQERRGSNVSSVRGNTRQQHQPAERQQTTTTGGTTSSAITNNGRWQNVKTESFTTTATSSSLKIRQQHHHPPREKEGGGGTYEERRERIERRAIEESRAAKRGGGGGREEDGNTNNTTAVDNKNNDNQEEEEEDIQSLLSWVGPLIIIDNNGRPQEDDDSNRKKDDEEETKKNYFTQQYSCTYYQDRDKRYPFTTDKRGYDLLSCLMLTNRKLLHINRCMIEKFGTTNNTDDDNNNNVDDDAMDIIIRIGQGLYAHKPTLRTSGVTWSTEEYSHPGLQRMYLRMKSIQRFTEIWSLLERAESLGVFDDIIMGSNNNNNASSLEKNVIRIAAVGGGPGYELLATKLFFEDRVPHGIQLELTCMDVCPAWRDYAEALGFKFVQYDIDNDTGISPLDAMGLEIGQLHFCIISCVMIYVTNNKVMSMFHKLIHNDGVKAMLVSERGERTMACTMMEELGGKVIRLIDQTDGMDERQAIWSSQEFCNEQLRTCYPDYEAHQSKCVFPNVPYCEHKERRRGGGSGRYKR